MAAPFEYRQAEELAAVFRKHRVRFLKLLAIDRPTQFLPNIGFDE